MTVRDAALSGDVAALTAALDADPTTLNTPGPGGWPALHLAGHFGHLNSVELLLARGANIDLRSANDKQNLATHATAGGRVPEARAPILERLLAAGVPVDATQHGGFTALHSTCRNGDEACIRRLLARGADIDKPADDGCTPDSLLKVGSPKQWRFSFRERARRTPNRAIMEVRPCSPRKWRRPTAYKQSEKRSPTA